MSEPSTGRADDGSVTTALRRRLAARDRSRRWSRTRVVLVTFGVVAVLAVGAWVVLGSSLLDVRTVEVRGVSGAVAADVRERAASELGTPLARVDVDAVTTRLEDITGVAAVTVTRQWPHTLRVEAVGRRAAAVTSTRGGYQVLDASGVVLASRATRPAGLPTVVVGDGPGANLADGLTVLRSAPPSVRARVRTIDVRSAQDVRLRLNRGVTVRWGSTDDAARKAAVLTALIKRKATVYDVSAPDLPTTRR